MSTSTNAEPRYIPISRRKRAQLQASIPPQWRLPQSMTASATTREGCMRVPNTCGILTAREIELTERYDATELAGMIRERAVRCVEVAEAFCKRAAIAHQLTSCLTEFFPNEALREAARLDTHLASGKSPLSPLHGVPISLKDTFNVPGHDSSLGLSTLCFTAPSPASSALVTLLRDAGAVLYAKTTVPQTLMALDTHSPVFGRTLNPHNGALTAGGSSGGEGALLALRGSVLGVGTDVGGSVRVPALCGGLVSVKPSVGRVPFAGQRTTVLLPDPGADHLGVRAVAGPMGRSVRDMRLFFDTVSAMRPEMYDVDVVPGSWDVSMPPPTSPLGRLQSSLRSWSGIGVPAEKITIGVVPSDGLTVPLPPVTRLLRSVATAAASHPLVDAAIDLDLAPILRHCQKVVNVLFTLDGNHRVMDLLGEGDELLSPWLRDRVKRRPPRSLDELRGAWKVREAVTTEMAKVWTGKVGQRKEDSQEARTIAAFICPIAPHPTPGIDEWNSANYTSAFNLLDLPAGAIPVRRFRPDDAEGEPPSGKPLGSWDRANRALWDVTEGEIPGGDSEVNRTQAARRKRERFVGGWMGVQVVAPRLSEGTLVRVMEVLEDAIKAAEIGEMNEVSKETGQARL